MGKYYLGIDLGSTTSKAVIINQNDEIIGRGITNTRANYKVAAEIAKDEAVYDARFTLLTQKLQNEIEAKPEFKKYFKDIRSVFQYRQFKRRMESLEILLNKTVNNFIYDNKNDIAVALKEILDTVRPQIKNKFVNEDLGSQNQFFRDIVSEHYNAQVEKVDKPLFEPLMLAFDKSITPVENEMMQFNFKELVHESMKELEDKYEGLADEQEDGSEEDWYYAELNAVKNNYKIVESTLREHIDEIASHDIRISNMVGTGYGRALLPFPDDCIKSEILCHAFFFFCFF